MAITLKRLYHKDPTGALRRDAQTGALLVSGVRVLRAGPTGTRQHFTPRLIEQGVAAGWLSMAQGRLVIDAEGGAIVYRIDRAPGYVCSHCAAPLDGGPSAQEHLASAHPGVPSPDPSNPSGYRRDHFYACTRVE